MVKKTETPKSTETAKGGKGKKNCPDCKKTWGVRKGKCDCGHEFPKTESNGTPRAAGLKTATRTVDPLALATLLKKLGGVKKVQEAIDSIAEIQAKAQAEEAKLAELGGVEGAKAAVKVAQEFVEALNAN